MAEHDMASLCYKLDEVCPGYEFFYSRRGGMDVFCVYRAERDKMKPPIAVIEYPDGDEDYAITKIILQYGGGTIPA